MGWDGTGMNCYEMGWGRKICPMDKPGFSAKNLRIYIKNRQRFNKRNFVRSSQNISGRK